MSLSNKWLLGFIGYTIFVSLVIAFLHGASIKDNESRGMEKYEGLQ